MSLEDIPLEEDSYYAQIYLLVKLLCVNSTFSSNFQYLSFKYGLTEADWYINIDHLMGKVRKKNVYTVSKAYFI